MDIAIGNYILNVYFGSFDVPDNNEHLYYKFTFMTSDKIPIASTMMNEWSYDILLYNMENLLESSGFEFEFQPSEPLVNYSLWVGYDSINDYNPQNIFEDSGVEIALFKTKFGKNEELIFNVTISLEDYYKLWKTISGKWWNE